jgi:hypothetical protein
MILIVCISMWAVMVFLITTSGTHGASYDVRKVLAEVILQS